MGKFWGNGAAEPERVAVNFDDLEQHLRQVPAPVEEYAPPAVRVPNPEREMEIAVRKITSFAALPTMELDDLIAIAGDELADLKASAQRVRDAYVEVTDKLRTQIERQRKVQRLAAQAMAQLSEQCARLDQPELPFAEPAHDTEH